MGRRSSRLLDRGNETMVVIPISRVVDRLGNAHRVPNEDYPITIRVNVSTDRQASAELPGQVDVKVLKVSFRGFPTDDPTFELLEPDSYDRIEIRGEEWDVAVPPVESKVTRATKHWTVILRSRNRKVTT